MTNKEVCNAFVNKTNGQSGSMRTDGVKIYSYNTCIGEWVDGKIIINASKYSVTTSKQQNYLRGAASYKGYVETTEYVPRNSGSLKSYL